MRCIVRRSYAISAAITSIRSAVSWRKVDATKALMQYSQKQKSPKMLGHLFTTWSVTKEKLTGFSPIVEGLKLMVD